MDRGLILIINVLCIFSFITVMQQYKIKRHNIGMQLKIGMEINEMVESHIQHKKIQIIFCIVALCYFGSIMLAFLEISFK